MDEKGDSNPFGQFPLESVVMKTREAPKHWYMEC